EKDKAYLHIIDTDEKVKKTHFPEFLKPKEFYVFSSNSQIYTMLINETNTILLYSASSKDLRFVRIGENIRLPYSDLNESCIAVKTFAPLPGVLIMNREITIKDQLMVFTAISYNFGLKWTHIVLPNIIKDFPCFWPSCYLQLSLECHINSIRFSEKNGDKDYSGLFRSIDAGYSWENIPSVINSVHILNYGSILLGIPTILYSFLYAIIYHKF
ncbi:hypothetical protein HZS_3152, partial [Henneguya salminicola]